jgi:hypothetical protein
MAYTVNKTNSSSSPNSYTVQDGVINNQTDLSFVGKGYAGYGETIGENFLHLLENFANSSAPSKPITGQLWWDSTNNKLQVYNGAAFQTAGGSAPYQSDQPSNLAAGDIWIDSDTGQMYFYNGTSSVLVGPPSSTGTTNGFTFDAILDSGDNTQNITKLFNDGNLIAIISEDTFTPKVSLSGFASIKKGITLSTAIADNKFQGTATDADALGGVAAANYLRSNANDTTSGTLGILVDGTTLTLGAGSDITFSMSSDNLTIAQTTQDKDIIFTVNDGGSTTTLMTLDGDTGRLELPSVGDLRVKGNLTVDGTQTIFNTTTLSIEDNIIELNRNISSNSGMPNYSGLKVNRGETSTATEQDLYWVWDETFADDGTTIHGNAGGAWTAFKSGGGDDEMSAPTLVDLRANVVHATSTSAQYADLAERYAADMQLAVGEVVMLGGSEEVTRCDTDLCSRVFGVVSESPAFLMNAQAGNNDSHPMIALKGRVFVKLKGTGSAGDRIVSAGNGEARVGKEEEISPFNVIGRLIKDKYSQETQLTECVIGVK